MSKETLQQHLNTIATYFSEGAAWHRRAANECRKLHIRGWGRWHEAEALYDFKAHLELEKLVRDNLQYAPVADVNYLVRAYAFTIDSMEGFKAHHQSWIDRENLFTQALMAAIEDSRSINIEVYKCLCCIAEEVQNEAMRVAWVHESMAMTGWNPHDLSVKSKWLHDYFECHYDGGKIDFNIG